MRYLFGFLCVCALGLMPLIGCSESNNTFECGDFTPKLTADGREVIYRRDICEPPECTLITCFPNVVDSHLLVHDVETRAMSQLPLKALAFDVSSDGGVIVYIANAELAAISDRGSGNTTRLDIAEFGMFLFPGPAPPSISGNGQVVALTIVRRDGDGPQNAIFLYDRATEQIERATTQPLTYKPSLSNDGRFLAFQTGPGLSGVDTAIHVLDRATGQSALVSVNSDGEPANAASFDPVISGDGRFVVFSSAATNLIAPSPPPPIDGPGSEFAEVYLHDRETGTTSLISTAADSGEPSGGRSSPDAGLIVPHAISTDGQFIVYESDADNIVPVESQASAPGNNVYRHDAGTDRTTRVSINSLGKPANGFSTDPSISDDGRFIAFITTSTNLDPDDVDSDQDVYLHDVRLGETIWVSRD